MITAHHAIALALRANFNDDSFVLAFRAARAEVTVDDVTLAKIFNVGVTAIEAWADGIVLPRQSERANILGVMLECLQTRTGSLVLVPCELN
jgi:DNA-binding transcriptional regulator YiaG